MFVDKYPSIFSPQMATIVYLPEEMLRKWQVLFIQFMLWNNQFPSPFYIPQLVKSLPFYILKKVPLSGKASRYMPL